MSRAVNKRHRELTLDEILQSIGSKARVQVIRESDTGRIYRVKPAAGILKKPVAKSARRVAAKRK